MKRAADEQKERQEMIREQKKQQGSNIYFKNSNK